MTAVKGASGGVVPSARTGRSVDMNDTTPTEVWGGPWWADPDAGLVVDAPTNADPFTAPSGCHPCVECTTCEFEALFGGDGAGWLDANGLCPDCRADLDEAAEELEAGLS